MRHYWWLFLCCDFKRIRAQITEAQHGYAELETRRKDREFKAMIFARAPGLAHRGESIAWNDA